MSVQTTIKGKEGAYFLTFTCEKWLPLFELTNAYDCVYKWFDHLKLKSHKINGYIIMPNHLHVLIEFINEEKKINTIVSNSKRFLAYEIVDRLKNQKDTDTLLQLQPA